MPHGTWKGSGTWESSGPDLSGLIAPAVIVGVTVGVAYIVEALMWWIVTAAGLAVAIWLATRPRRQRRKAEVIAGWAAQREAVEEAGRARELERHQRRLEIAAASAPQVQVTNTIDPAALLAAAFTSRYHAEPVQVVRAEVER